MFNSKSNNKKAVVTLTTFSLIILISLLILSFSYFFYNNLKERAQINKIEIDVVNSVNNLRSELFNIVTYTNSNITYYSEYESDNLEIELNKNYFSARYDFDSKIVVKNISSVGLNFCSKQIFNPSVGGTFFFNGSCITLS